MQIVIVLVAFSAPTVRALKKVSLGVKLGGRAWVDIIAGYRILSAQNEGGLARLPVRHPFGALDGGLTGGIFGSSSILIESGVSLALLLF